MKNALGNYSKVILLVTKNIRNVSRSIKVFATQIKPNNVGFD